MSARLGEDPERMRVLTRFAFVGPIACIRDDANGCNMWNGAESALLQYIQKGMGCTDAGGAHGVHDGETAVQGDDEGLQDGVRPHPVRYHAVVCVVHGIKYSLGQKPHLHIRAHIHCVQNIGQTPSAAQFWQKPLRGATPESTGFQAEKIRSI